MDKERIIEFVHNMETKEDLLKLLNRIKGAEIAEMGFGEEFRPFTIKQINFYCNPNNSFHRYRQFRIPKKRPGEFRTITVPRNRSFMAILHYINIILKAMYTPSNYAMGFTEGRSVVNNANVHKGQNYILNIDLKDFFPSIEQPRVWKRLQVKPFEFAQPVANVIAGLCSMKETRVMPDGTKKAFYVLPQGAPTSPIITNMICDKLDHRLAGLAKRFGLQYSRYADDITFSSMHNVYKKDGEFWTELERIIKDQGFAINEKKTRLQKKGSRQEVTGIVVSERLNVTQKYVRDIRNLLYMWEKHGIGVAECKFLPKYKQEKGHVKKGNPDIINVIDGKLMYLKMVKGEEDSVYTRLHDKFFELCAQVLDPQNRTEQGITYLETSPLLDFEQNNSTSVEIVNEDKKRYAFFNIEDKKMIVSINKSIKQEELNKEKLAISCCRNACGKTFWLLHKADKVTVPPHKEIDIDELNNELDNLLNI